MTAPGLYPEHDLFIQSMKAEEHASLDEGEDHHAPRPGVLRLGLVRVRPVSGGGFCLYGVKNASRINQGGPSVHANGNAQGFGNLFSGRAGLQSGVSVEHNATVAAGGDGDSKGN